MHPPQGTGSGVVASYARRLSHALWLSSRIWLYEVRNTFVCDCVYVVDEDILFSILILFNSTREIVLASVVSD